MNDTSPVSSIACAGPYFVVGFIGTLCFNAYITHRYASNILQIPQVRMTHALRYAAITAPSSLLIRWILTGIALAGTDETAWNTLMTFVVPMLLHGIFDFILLTLVASRTFNVDRWAALKWSASFTAGMALLFVVAATPFGLALSLGFMMSPFLVWRIYQDERIRLDQ